MDPRTSRLHAVVGSSWRLRAEAVDGLLARWDGPVKRATEPAEAESIVLGLDSPSIFEPAALWVVSAGDAWVRRHKDLLKPLAGAPVAGGLIILNAAKVPANESLGKALAAAGCLHRADPPKGRDFQAWLLARLHGLPQGVERPREVAEELQRHRGEDVDDLISAMDQAVLWAGDKPLSVEAVTAVVGGEAAQPIWEFTGAVLEGRADKALRLIHAGAGLEPHQAMGALANEVRRTLCCLASSQDGEAAALAGLRGKPNLYHARQRARDLGKACLTRLLTGVLQAQRQLRRTGADPVQVIELLVAHAARVIRPSER